MQLDLESGTVVQLEAILLRFRNTLTYFLTYIVMDTDNFSFASLQA